MDARIFTDDTKVQSAQRGYNDGRTLHSDYRHTCKRTECNVQSGGAVIGVLGNAVNSGSEREIAEGMLLAMIREHRTLQQGVVRILCRFIEMYADLDPGQFTDDRNRATWTLANDLASITSTTRLPLI